MNSKDLFKKTMQVMNTGRPVFMPLVYGLAARIEQVPLRDMVTDPTYYANLLDGAQKLLQQDAIITNFDPNLEAEIFGCQTDWPGEYQLPVTTGWNECQFETACIDNSKRIPVMLEAIKRLIETRGKEVGIVGVINGACSLTTQIARNTRLDKKYDMADIASLAGSQITKLTKSICELRVDAIIYREDQLGDHFPSELNSQTKSYGTIYTTLFNLTRFYDIAALILVRKIGPDGVEEIFKKLRPNGIILNGKSLDACELMRLKTLSESQKIAIGLPIPLEEQKKMLEQYQLFNKFIRDNCSKGFFYTSDAEVSPDIALEPFLDLVAKVRGASES